MCGPDGLQNVLLTTTQWTNLYYQQGKEHEKRLVNGDFWGWLIAEGASVATFMGTRESGLELIAQLMGNKLRLLDIQYQIVEAYGRTEDEREQSRC